MDFGTKVHIYTLAADRGTEALPKYFEKKHFATKMLHIFATKRFLKINYPMRRDVFQAIADPTRRAILALVAVQSMTPNALAAHFDTTRQAVSKHLRILTECELLRQEQKGREIFYRLEIDKMKEIDQWLAQFRELWQDRFSQLDSLLHQLKTNTDENQSLI